MPRSKTGSIGIKRKGKIQGSKSYCAKPINPANKPAPKRKAQYIPTPNKNARASKHLSLHSRGVHVHQAIF